MKTYKIHMIRHGLIEGNLKGYYIGKTDAPIIPEGLMMLKAMKEKYQYPQAELFYSSPMLRCMQTMKVLYPEAEPIAVPGLAECDFGAFEGKTPQELEGNPEYQKWLKPGDVPVAPPGGENSHDFVARICQAFNSLVTNMMREGKTEAVLCTHGGVISTLLSVYGLPQQSVAEWACQSGKGYTVRITPSIWMRGGMFEVIDAIPYENER